MRIHPRAPPPPPPHKHKRKKAPRPYRTSTGILYPPLHPPNKPKNTTRTHTHPPKPQLFPPRPPSDSLPHYVFLPPRRVQNPFLSNQGEGPTCPFAMPLPPRAPPPHPGNKNYGMHTGSTYAHCLDACTQPRTPA